MEMKKVNNGKPSYVNKVLFLICDLISAHKGQVRGVVVDAVNRYLVSAGGDCIVRFWNFDTQILLHSMKMDSQIASIVLHRERYDQI